MVASDDRVVDINFVGGACVCVWVLVVELNHLDSVCEGVERELGALSDGDELVVISAAVLCEGGDGLEELLELVVGFDIVDFDGLYGESSNSIDLVNIVSISA